MALIDQPIDLKMNLITREFEIVNGDIVWSTGLDAVAQNVFLAVTTHMGEVFYDLTEGIPYFEREGVPADRALLGNKFDEFRAISEFSRVIRAVADVEDIEALTATFNPATRTMDVRWTVLAIFGDTFTGSTALTR